MDYGLNTTTINGILEMNFGGSVVSNPPIYGNASTLIYNIDDQDPDVDPVPHDRTLEFSATSGAGYPNNVNVVNGTTLNLAANSPSNLGMSGNLTLGGPIFDFNVNQLVDTAGIITMGTSTKSLAVAGNVTVGDNIIVGSSLTLSTATGGNVTVGGNITVNNGCSINVPANDTNPAIDGASITLAGNMIHNGTGISTFENGTSLLQTSASTENDNVGKITYKRNSSLMFNNFDFTYWSSPVAGKTLGNIWMSVNSADTFYTWNNITESWFPRTAATVMERAIGYIARARNNGSGTDFNNVTTIYTSGIPWQARFNGVPNTGNYSTSITQSIGTLSGNLLGNPYPSAVDLIAFRNDPDNAARLTGNFYFWTSNTPITNNVYFASDYAIFNVALNAGIGTTSGNIDPVPDKFVDAGQGFFAEGLSNGTVTFKNSHRVATNNNAFYRMSVDSNANNTLESSKLWLNLSNVQGLFKQQLLTYTQGATNGYDPTLDARTFDGNAFIDFYSTGANQKFIIQSRTLPFVNSDLVSIGFKTSVAGAYTIAIDHFEGLFATQTIFLQDNLLNIVHNLSLSPYNFNTTTGTFDNRFVLKYTSTMLGTNNPNLSDATLIVSNTDNLLKIKSSNENISKVVVYDLLGRNIFEQKNISATTFETSKIAVSQQALIVKIILENGIVETRKVVF